MSFLEQYFDKWEPVTEIGCYIWTGKCNNMGYALLPNELRVKGTTRLITRVVLAEKLGRPIGSKLTASHICGNGHLGCVNPDHLVEENLSDNFARRTLENKMAATTAATKMARKRAKGYFWNKDKNRWTVHLSASTTIRRKDGRGFRKFVGHFRTENEAKEAYRLAVEKI